MTGYTIKREIWASMPAIDGRLSKLTQEQRDAMTRRIYYNTDKALRYGVLIPVKEGHFSLKQELQGKLLKVTMEERKEPSKHLVIIGDLFIEKEFYKIVKDGKLPGTSIEYDEYANLTQYAGFKDEIKSEYIFSIALCGRDPAAMPNLKTLEVGNTAQTLFARRRSSAKYQLGGQIMEEIKSAIVAAFDEIAMPVVNKPLALDVLNELKNRIIAIHEEYYKTMMDDGEPGEPAGEPEETPPEESMKKDKEYRSLLGKLFGKTAQKEPGKDKMKLPVELEHVFEKFATENEGLKTQIAEMQKNTIDNEYQNLFQAGKITKEQKTHFEKIAKSNGVQFAKEVYAAATVATPPDGTVIDKPKDGEPNEKMMEAYMEWGLSEEDAKKAFQMSRSNGQEVNHG